MESKTFVINKKNIFSTIEILREAIKNCPNPEGSFLVLPHSKRELSARYRGKGRPRNSDYDYNEISVQSMLEEVSKLGERYSFNAN